MQKSVIPKQRQYSGAGSAGGNGRYMMVDGTGSVWGSTGWYLVVLGQMKTVLGQYKAVRAESIWVSG